MSAYKYEQGIGSVGAYQVSGLPHLTASVVENGNGASPAASQFKISFPKVTRTIKIINTGSAPLRVHFADITVSPALHNEHNFMIIPPDGNHYGSGSANNYITGSYKNRPIEIGVKCTSLYMSSTGQGQSGFQLLAELTSIAKENMYVLSGSGINGDGRIV
jgi:hypothetical protein